MANLLIRNARVVDGTGNPWYIADVAVTGDTISEIGRLSDDGSYDEVIEAEGLTLAPGFFDMHSHSDLSLLVHPAAAAKIRQGITTELISQDGLGVAPMVPEHINEYRKYLSGLQGDPAIEWTWRSFADYLTRMETIGTATNVASLLSHGPLRVVAVGLEERHATAQELSRMAELARQAFAEGAFGLSTGLIYPPCVFAADDELHILGEATAAAGGLFVVHVRNERGLIKESIQEIFDLGYKTGVKPHISHLKVIGRENWGTAGEILALFDEARNNGLDVGFDQYPYPAGSTMLSILVPAHAHAGGPESFLERLKDKEMRALLAEQMVTGLPGWENINTAAGWDRILITGVNDGPNKQWEGKTIFDIACQKDISPQDVIFDLLLEEELQVSMVNFSLYEADVVTILQHSLGMLGTDGLLGGKPHPRAYGSTARILQKYVREDGVISLEQAIARMTSRPAAQLGIYDRGIIRPGMKADLVLFDAETVRDMATYTDSCRHPEGFSYVWVNGTAALANGVETGFLSGRVLRKGQ